ncbi:MAG: DUF1015 domain-containing protein [Ruminococcaceae bacterium]|nr:DUF1015 domain-containing protein [Oscillospiraceae bacterium]
MKALNCLTGAEILLPDFNQINGTLWSTVACDQYTSEPHYWQQVEALVGEAPSTLRLTLPEIYLEESARRIPAIHKAMEEALRSVLQAHPNAMIYLERTQSDGKVRRGLIGAVDLEQYDYQKGSVSLIRATEGTVLERIPPRVAIRRSAPLELPHVMLLIDDPEKTVIEECAAKAHTLSTVYDFDLMLNGGHVTGRLIDEAEQTRIREALAALVTPQAMEARYGSSELAPLLFAVGDGNHSLATAKASFEEIKAQLGAEAAASHPARYALAEIVNLHDPALEFEPIYRALFGADANTLTEELTQWLSTLRGAATPQAITLVTSEGDRALTVETPEQQLTVGTLQVFLDGYLQRHPEVKIDYIHGEASLRRLVAEQNALGFLFDGMTKDQLFRTVIYDGALPRKTFSMGHADDKRFYLECRRIK